MTYLAPFIPFLKVILAFVVMVLGMRKKIGLGLSILIGGFVLGMLFYMHPVKWFEVGCLALTKEKFLLLIAIVGLILVLSDGLERTGQSKRLMDALSGYLTRPRLRLIFFPALIGLLPMPGGAVFSAPMVKEVSRGMDISNEQKVVVNYWFRHVWELAWPLYPGIILTVALADIPIYALISKTWPAVLAMFGLGYFFFLRPGVLQIKVQDDVQLQGEKNGRAALVEGIPLLVAIVGAIGSETVLAKFFPDVPFELGVIGALIAAVVSVMVQNRLGFRFLQQILCKKSLWSMLAVIAAIFIFKDTMTAAGVVRSMAEAAGGTAALFAAAIFLPFLVGMVSGINVAFVGATFPLLIGLLYTLGLENHLVAFMVLASFAGFTGVMISPIHICFVLTCDYFGANLGTSWKRMVLPCLLFCFFGCLLFTLLLFI